MSIIGEDSIIDLLRIFDRSNAKPESLIIHCFGGFDIKGTITHECYDRTLGVGKQFHMLNKRRDDIFVNRLIEFGVLEHQNFVLFLLFLDDLPLIRRIKKEHDIDTILLFIDGVVDDLCAKKCDAKEREE